MTNGDPLQQDELFYRTVPEQEVEGDIVLPNAMRMPNCSGGRSSMTTPDEMRRRRPQEPHLVYLEVSNLPPPVARPDKVVLSYRAVHRPKDDYECHSQIEMTTPEGRVPTTLNDKVLIVVKVELARRARILR